MSSIVVKGGGAAGGVGLGGLGIAGATGQLSGYQPPSKFLYHRADFMDTPKDYTGTGPTFWYAYGKFMVDHDSNSSWWSKSYQRVWESNDNDLSTEFQEVKKSRKGVDKVCKENYVKQKTYITDTLEKNIWEFCSTLDKKPETISTDDNTYSGKWVGVDAKNKTSLLKISDGNLSVWEHIFEKILKKDLEDETKKGGIDETFKSVNSASDLKEVCKKAYESSPNESEDDSIENYGANAWNYCSLDISGLVKYPKKPTQ